MGLRLVGVEVSLEGLEVGVEVQVEGLEVRIGVSKTIDQRSEDTVERAGMGLEESGEGRRVTLLGQMEPPFLVSKEVKHLLCTNG